MTTLSDSNQTKPMHTIPNRSYSGIFGLSSIPNRFSRPNSTGSWPVWFGTSWIGSFRMVLKNPGCDDYCTILAWNWHRCSGQDIELVTLVLTSHASLYQSVKVFIRGTLSIVLLDIDNLWIYWKLSILVHNIGFSAIVVPYHTLPIWKWNGFGTGIENLTLRSFLAKSEGNVFFKYRNKL